MDLTTFWLFKNLRYLIEITAASKPFIREYTIEIMLFEI